MQPSEEFEQNNFDRIQCALDIVHTIDELEYPLQSRSSTPKDTALLILEAACKFYDADWCGLIQVDLDAKRYDTVLTVAKELGKGWYATLLSTVIDETVIIPSYMLQALAFVSQSIIDEKLLKKMALHTLEGYYGDSAVVLKEFLTNAKTPDEISTAIQAFCDTYPDNNFAYFISFRKDVVHG